MDARSNKEKILDAATELFSVQGYSSTSIRALANAAGVNIGSINHYFGSKDKLFWAARRSSVQRIDASLLMAQPSNNVDLSKVLVRTFLELKTEFRLAISLLMSNDFPKEPEQFTEKDQGPKPPALAMITKYFEDNFEDSQSRRLIAKTLLQLTYHQFMIFGSHYVRSIYADSEWTAAELESEFLKIIDLLTETLEKREN